MGHIERKPLRLNATAGLLDIGSSKVACAVVKYDPDAGLPGLAHAQVLGVGITRSRGIKFGAVIDLGEAEDAVRRAVGEAEKRAGLTLDSVIVSVTCGRLSSLNFTAHAPIESGVIAADDVARLLSGARAYTEREGRSLLHLNRVSYLIDGAPAGDNPLGMAANKLSANLHAVTLDDAAQNNLVALIRRCHLDIETLIAAPQAAGMAVTTPEERELGVTCIDFGGGTTTVASFADGHFVHVDAITGGGGVITRDIARSLQTPVAEAERIKVLYGTMNFAQSDAHEVFGYPMSDCDGALGQATRVQLAQIVERRVGTLVETVADRLQSSGVRAVAGDNVVLTGGMAELPGFAEYVAAKMSCSVRIGRPKLLCPPIEGGAGAAFSVLSGLLPAWMAGGFEVAAGDRSRQREAGYLWRVGEWLREGF